MAISNFAKFRLLLWKNYILQKRLKVQTVLEIFLPLVFVAVLVITRNIIESKKYENGKTFDPFIPTDINRTRIFDNIFSYNNPNITNKTPFFIYYAPNNSETAELMNKAQETFFKFKARMLNQDFEVNFHLEGFDNETHLVDQYVARSSEFVLAAIVFNKLEKNYKETGEIDYSIRFPALQKEPLGVKFDNDKWLTELLYPIFQLLGPRKMDDNWGAEPGYHSQGFTYLQYAVEASILESIDPTKYKISHLMEIAQGSDYTDMNMTLTSTIGDFSVFMQRFPYPAFIDDTYLVALQGWLPLIFMLSFIYPSTNITKSIVVEKEKRLKESMKMMGLPNYLHWSAWFLKSFLFLLVSIIFMTILLKVKWVDGLAVITYADGTIVFIFLLAFVFSTITLSFFVSTLFSKANSAATASGVIWFLTYFPYFFLQPRYDQLSQSTKISSSYLSNTAMAFGCQIIAMFEGTGVGVQWNTIAKGVSPDDDFSLLQCILLLIGDGFIYLLLAIYVEAVWPGEFGVPLPWYFPFQKSYWVGPGSNSSVSSSNGHNNNNNGANMEFFEPPPSNAKAGIRIQGLTKRFGKKTAVNNLSLDMFDSQITALLGHNGAGKTTTMSMLTGLFPASSGTAIINNFDIRTNIKEVRDSLGLCPQHDVLFDELTVEEHLRFFCLMKGYPNAESEIKRMLAALNLEPKKDAMSKTLSGGMKRRLSVGIALVGGSKIVLLDEPTSGMDPGNRRSTWDLLTSEKKNRTILLSTHFMEEADLLGDRIAIMADGELQTVGSSLFLKKKHGGGYHLIIVKQEGCDVSKITNILRKHLGEAEIEQDVGAELSYSLPDNKSHLFGDMFEELEYRRQELKIDSYGASITTMEEVFMRVGKAAEEKKHKSQPNVNVSIESLQKGSDYKLYEKHVKNTGFTHLVQQLWAMIVKKALYSSRNRVLLAVQTIIPVAFLIISLIMLETLPGIQEAPALKVNLDIFGDTTTTLSCPDIGADPLCKAYQDYGNQMGTSIKSTDNLTKTIIEESEKNLIGTNYGYIIGMEKMSKENHSVTAFFNNQPLHAPPITLNYLSNALLRLNKQGNINASNFPLPNTRQSEVDNAGSAASSGFQIGFNIAFGMSFLASSFVVFLIKERESKAKHLQYVSGVKFWVFWIANFAFDIVNYLIPAVLLIIVLLAFQAEGFSGKDSGVLGYVFVLFLLYGWAVIPLTYLFSFWFSIPSSGFTRMTMLNVFTGMAPILAVTILQIPSLGLVKTAEILDWVFMIFPNYNLGYGIVQMSTNTLYRELCPALFKNGLEPELFCALTEDNPCCEKFLYPDGYGYTAWHPPGIGRNLLFLFLVGLLSFVALFISESKIIEKLLGRKKNEQGEIGHVNDPLEDSDVAAEAARIRNTNLTHLHKTDNLVIRDLSKSYGTFQAVKCLNLGVQQRECFGLLGVNGAGKTTTFKMLTGDLPVSGGDAFIDGYSINSDIKSVQKNLGYCPQFDAIIEELTGRETIRLFARLRGIQESEIDRLVDKLGSNLLFNEHMEKRVGQYSGGNKRKLSTALALVGNPPIVFLDEPTTGMDPVARRHLWNCISSVREAGTSIVLTSHSMEECEALCTRLAIMVNGQFRCLGSTQHLKSKFGEGYTVICQITTKVEVNKKSFQESQRRRSSGVKSDWEREIQPLQQYIEDSFPGSKLKDLHPGYVHYHVTNTQLTWGDLFRKMEHAKTLFNIEAYSVGQTTLEQVFLNFTKGQVTDE